MDLRMQMALGALLAVALTAPVASAQQAEPQAATLPAPPYARDGATSALRRPAGYGGEQTYDRYGGGTPHPRVAYAAPQATAPAPYAGPRLGWMGKTEEAAAPARAAPYAPQARPGGYPTMAFASARQAAPVAPAAAPASAPSGWSYVPPIGQGSAYAPAAAPTSIYDAPPPVSAPPPAQIAQATQAQGSPADGARHYSLHREYGIQPDPIPLPPQFFGATADLTQPATDEPMRKVTTADGKSHNAVQPEGGQ